MNEQAIDKARLLQEHQRAATWLIAYFIKMIMKVKPKDVADTEADIEVEDELSDLTAEDLEDNDSALVYLMVYGQPILVLQLSPAGDRNAHRDEEFERVFEISSLEKMMKRANFFARFEPNRRFEINDLVAPSEFKIFTSLESRESLDLEQLLAGGLHRSLEYELEDYPDLNASLMTEADPAGLSQLIRESQHSILNSQGPKSLSRQSMLGQLTPSRAIFDKARRFEEFCEENRQKTSENLKQVFCYDEEERDTVGTLLFPSLNFKKNKKRRVAGFELESAHFAGLSMMVVNPVSQSKLYPAPYMESEVITNENKLPQSALDYDGSDYNEQDSVQFRSTLSNGVNNLMENHMTLERLAANFDFFNQDSIPSGSKNTSLSLKQRENVTPKDKIADILSRLGI